MLTLYTDGTPNGHKVSIFLEEAEHPYRSVQVDIMKGDQFKSAYLKIRPNNKIPAIVDSEGPGGQPIALFESVPILNYLGEKLAKFLSTDPRIRYATFQWLMFQMGGIGPMLGQAHHFRKYAPEKIPYAIERYTKEATRLYGVLNRRLGESEYLAGDYSIADIATFPWIRWHDMHGQKLEDFPNVERWYNAIAERPGVKRGMLVPRKIEADWSEDRDAWNVMFGNQQYDRR
ncbi:MAG: glutathione S-transferase N-terminal domain-containing protein [Alphaproteobacteria bacterium]|nr:glutathione S-transferase N-terminal domain-containing protein [Alphaproteobacteria bacterium]